MKRFCLLLLAISFMLYATKHSLALVCGEEIPPNTPEGVLRDYMADCNKKIADSKGAQATLAAAINYFNGQIGLTQAQIVSTQKELDKLELEIGDLSGKISTINVSLDDLTRYFITRVRESYKGKDNLSYTFVINRGDFGNIVRQVEYVKRVRDHDRDNLLSLEKSRLDLGRQKEQKEQKQIEVEALKKKLSTQKSKLSSQKAEKDNLLLMTKNNEKKYQSLLNEAVSELNALLTSKFSEKRIVKKGETIGIMGSTGNSSGPHLHFGVYNLKEGETFNYYASLNPIEYLVSKNVLVENTACDDVVNGSINKTLGNGSHNWPMDEIRITQCWGHTPWSFQYSNRLHDGLDIVDPNKIVKATDDGVAYFYRGTNAMGNNVRIFHNDGKMTLYLHLL